MKNICTWAKHPLEQDYHDNEWGNPVHDDRTLFEFLILEGVQAGLSWLTVLKKRDEYRKAYDNFEPEIVAKYDDAKQKELLENEGLVRNKLKISASIENAKAFLKVQKEFGSFNKYIWSFVDGKTVVNHWQSLKEIPAQTETSNRMSKDLKKRGFKFVGPTICYAFMQATGMVNDHETSCYKRQNKSGFTLVELSIAIIIIGLIVSGVLGASSLIKSSKMSAMMTEIEQIKTSVNAFKLEYDALPGDFIEATSYWSASGNGNGNNLIEIRGGISPNYEENLVFEHLSRAEIIPGNHLTAHEPSINKNGAGGTLMQSSFDPNAGYMLYSTPTPSGAYPSYRGFYGNKSGLVIKAARDRSFYHDKGFISPIDAKKFDKKFDDGSADKGDIHTNHGADSSSGSTVFENCVTAVNGNNWNTTSNDFDLSEESETCIMFFFLSI